MGNWALGEAKRLFLLHVLSRRGRSRHSGDDSLGSLLSFHGLTDGGGEMKRTAGGKNLRLLGRGSFLDGLLPLAGLGVSFFLVLRVSSRY